MGALAACFWLGAAGPASVRAAEPAPPEIIARHATAMGGLDAWRKIQSMVWIGHVENAQQPAQFVLALKRPNKTRFEMRGGNQFALRVYDGNQGWKLHVTQGTPMVQPYTAEELAFAHDERVIDGPLMDAEANGLGVTLEGVDDIEGHKAYRLNVTLPSGNSRREWIDAESFLDIKSERHSRDAAGKPRTVTVYYRDFREVEGMRIPFIIESGADMARAGERLVIERVTINPPLEDAMFAKPNLMRRGSMDAASASERATGIVARPDPRP